MLAVAGVLSSCGASKKSKKSDNFGSENNQSTKSQKKAFAAEFSQKLGIQVPETVNQTLMTEVYNWLGVPYKLGGNDKKGVDCSGFLFQIYPLVYQMQIPRTTAQLFEKAVSVDKKLLKEGDLVFFKINTKQVGHAGIFLFDSYFAHASTSKGVMISRLDEAYWSRYFVGGGRFLR